VLVMRLFAHPCECFVPAQAKRWAEWPPRHAHGISPPVEKASPFDFAQGSYGAPVVHLCTSKSGWLGHPPFP